MESKKATTCLIACWFYQTWRLFMIAGRGRKKRAVVCWVHLRSDHVPAKPLMPNRVKTCSGKDVSCSGGIRLEQTSALETYHGPLETPQLVRLPTAHSSRIFWLSNGDFLRNVLLERKIGLSRMMRRRKLE